MHLEFETDNAAFRDEESGELYAGEVARLLRLAASEVEAGYTENTLKDANGNTVGSWTA